MFEVAAQPRQCGLREALPGLTSVLAYFLYVYSNVALSIAYNNLFLVYVALFSASLFAFALTVRSIDLEIMTPRFSPHLSRRAPAIFMFAAGG